MTKAWAGAVAILVASMGVGAGAVALRARASDAKGSQSGRPGQTTFTRVVVEVVNATTSKGLARRAATLLRDRGFDVVAIETTKHLRDTTLVYDRSGHPEWARRAASALKSFGGPSPQIQEQPDSSRYLDITVVLGSTWRPPSQPLDL